jgi:trehalose 6-phosphate phosphatase
MSEPWWGCVALRVQAAPRCALFLDFDGTLAELKDKPGDARMPEATRRVLRTLVQRPKARVFFISGRRRSDLATRVGLPGCRYLGLFGFEGTDRAGAGQSAAVQRLRAQAEARVAELPNVWIEDKGLAFVLHHRDAAPRVRALARRRVGALVRSSPAVRQFESAHGVEVVPRGVTGKGAVVGRLLRMPALRHAVPIYVGDDLSDEPAFRAARHGVTIRVGPARPTAARYRLACAGDVREFLSMLARALR